MVKTLLPRILLALGLCATLALATTAGDKGAKDAKKEGKDVKKRTKDVKDDGIPGLSDDKFVIKALESDTAEITLGKIATERASMEEVKKFGQKMVADHTKSRKELIAILHKKDLKVKLGVTDKQAKQIRELQTKTGKEFDRAYMKKMVQDHEKALSLYKNEAKKGKDEELREFASKTAPIIEDHLKMAREIVGRLDGKKDAKKETRKDTKKESDRDR